MWPRRSISFAIALAPWVILCCRATSSVTDNRTFYDTTVSNETSAVEKRLPQRDRDATDQFEKLMGVAILDGNVRLARPFTWRIHSANTTPGSQFIRYVSSEGYSVGVYEKPVPSLEKWGTLLQQYERDVVATGSKVVGGHYPIALANTHGWVFTVERQLTVAEHPLVSNSREILLRSSLGLILIQIVHQEASLEGVDADLLHALNTLEVDK